MQNSRPSPRRAGPPASIPWPSQSRWCRLRTITWVAFGPTGTAARRWAGLWAAGEVASTGVHGANRLASNSLLEAVIFGARVAADVQARAVAGQAPARAGQAQGPASEPEGADAALETALRQLMSRHVGVIREGDGLVHALAELAAIETQASGARVRNMAVAGLLVAAAALQRRESRGAHWRSDYPASDPALARRMRMRLADARGIARAVALVPAA